MKFITIADIRYGGHHIEKNARILLREYVDGSPALVGVTANGETLVTATVNLAGYGMHPPEGEVFIKNWSENEGVLESLVAAGVISESLEEIPVGYVVAHRVKLKIQQSG